MAGLLILLLPETRYRPLPETLEEVEGWTKKSDKKPTELQVDPNEKLEMEKMLNRDSTKDAQSSSDI